MNLRVAEALVQCAKTLRGNIEKLGTDPVKAKELAKEVNAIESRIDKDYLDTKKLFIKYTRQVDRNETRVVCLC